jgi:multiple sugar transport system ATP-binding protein
MGAVSVREITIGFGEIKVLDKLSLEVAEGEFVVLLGPSGCGKSTLLNAIAGLLDVKAGQIWIGMRNVTWDEPKDRGIGMVFQSYSLYPRMSVEENLSFGLRIAKVAKDEIARRVAKASKLLQLEALLPRKPAELSGGQRQRVAIGRALVRQVDVFLFDEPLSNLDAKLRNELRVEIKKLHQEIGNTMIYVTHDQVEALTLADRIAVMRAGVIQQFATPTEIYRSPINAFVAGFIGSPGMNMIEGEVKDGMFASPGVSARLTTYPGSPKDAGRAILGVRPEHIGVGPAPEGRTMISGRVTVVEPMGGETVLRTDVAGRELTVRINGDLPAKLGEKIDMHFDVAQSSLFDRNSGARL